MPVELPIDQASNQQSVLAAVRQECAGPGGGRTFSAANFQFNPPDQNWINTARRRLQPSAPGGQDTRGLAEELKGGGDSGEITLGPINKGKVTLITKQIYQVSERSGALIWECEFLSYDGDSDHARFRITRQVRP